MEMPLRLKPCKCGNRDILVRKITYSCEQDAAYFCKCEKCGKMTPYIYGDGQSWIADQNKVIRAWNSMVSDKRERW